MVNNIIKNIKESEEKAKEIIALSKKESAEIVENAYLKSKEILRDTEREVIEIINKSEIKAKADAEKEIKALEEDFNKSLENIKKAVTSKEKEAINKVIQRVIN